MRRITLSVTFREKGLHGAFMAPMSKPVIADVMCPNVALVDSAEETARKTATVLTERSLARATGPGHTSFFVTDAPERFVRIGQRFLGARVESAVRTER